MAEKNSLIEQMLENLVNGEQQKAEDIFHEYVVAKSREIYEGLIESEMKDEEDDESSDKETDEEDDEVEEALDDEFALEADDEMDLEKDDPTDDLAAELDADMDDEEGETDDKSEEELFQDLDSIVDELQARFDELKDDGMSGEKEEVKDDFDVDMETVREYVEKVKAPAAGENADNTKSVVDNMKNDMGGTTANMARGGEEKGRVAPRPEDMNTGNVNVPGGKAGNSMSRASGHGAEKKGAAEKADNTASLFRGRR